MTRKLGWLLAAGFAISGWSGGASADSAVVTTAVTHTGWFADMQCAAPRVKKGQIGNFYSPDCIKRCLDEGKAPAFISEQAKDLFEVKEYKGVKDDIGWYVQVTGRLDETAKTFTVEAVKRLEYTGPQCALAKKPTKTQE